MTNQHSGGAIQSQALVLAIVQAVVFVLAMYLTSNIIESENGGISALVRTVGIGLAVWAFTRPHAGLFIVTFEAFSVDFIKKVAVYYGTASMGTIIDVLIVTMLAIVGTIGGTLIQGVALRRFKIPWQNWPILLGATLLAIAVLLANRAELGFAKAGENAFNTAVPIALVVPMTVFLVDRDKLANLLKAQFWLACVWAVWGIKQYYTGFLPLEWYYAETGLSEVASEHMLKFADPRPFGFGSGVPNYGVISAYTIYGVWLVAQQRRNRFLYALGTLTLFWGLVTSLQRTALLFPMIVVVCYYCFRTRGRTLATYAAMIIAFVIGVAFSDYLLDHLNDINAAIAVRGDWAEKVLQVGTFSERLASWQLLKTPRVYSWFGTHENFPTHDVFSRIILAYGVVGLTVVIAALVAMLTFMHGVVLRIADPVDRRTVTFLLATTVPNILLGFAGGGNFTTNPICLQIWTFFGAAVAIIVNTKLVSSEPTAVSGLRVRSLVAQMPGRASVARPPFPYASR